MKDINEKTIKFVKITEAETDNPGCNNGNYPEWEGILSSGETVCGITCRCGNGCSNTDCLPFVGETYAHWTRRNEGG